MYIKRNYSIQQTIEPGKVLVVYGPRRVGKTTLIRHCIGSYSRKVFIGTGEDRDVQNVFSSYRPTLLKQVFGSYDLIFIDEAQKIENCGAALKLLVDTLDHIPVIARGSASFDLAQKVGEPLTGRQKIITLYPFSAGECIDWLGGMDYVKRLEEFMLFGTYPETLLQSDITAKIEYLHSLRDSYLYKDILELENIRYSSKIRDLLTLLAFQIGNEVSLNELSNSLGIAKQTVERYLDLLEKCFVIKSVKSYSKNLRKEISKAHRYYFWDNGIRNAVINNFNFKNMRNDWGMLWENYLFIERIKRNTQKRIYPNYYFWRTYDQKEIDFIEERDGTLHGYEFKWSSKKQKIPLLWKKTYPDATCEVVSRDSFLSFLGQVQ